MQGNKILYLCCIKNMDISKCEYYFISDVGTFSLYLFQCTILDMGRGGWDRSGGHFCNNYHCHSHPHVCLL